MIGKKDEISITTIIGRDAECNGDFNSGGSVRIDGTVNGDINVSETVILGATGVVNGDIVTKVAIIGGEIIGSINAPEKTELTSTARVLGDITTKTIVIDENAIFQGSCNMNQDVSAKRPKPNNKVIKAGKKTAKAAIAEALRGTEDAGGQEGSGSVYNGGQAASEE